MMTRYRTLSAEARLEAAITELLAGSQQDFPVLDNGTVSGILRRNDLVQALAKGRLQARISEVMCADCRTVGASEPLQETLERMKREGCNTLAVMDKDKLVGLLSIENISELVMVRAALAKGNG